MADKSQSIQDFFLNECRRTKTPVTIFLVKGIKLSGVITWFDSFSLLLRRDGIAQLIYKHAVSTIAPLHSPTLPPAAETDDGGRKQTLQELFLDATERDGQGVTLYLMNGVSLQGAVAGHDQFVLFLTRGEQHQLVYKHAISTIQPSAALDLGPGDAA
jgi:host factor-I protein